MKRPLSIAGLVLALTSSLGGNVARAQDNSYLGEIRLVGYNVCPRWWLPADGRLLFIKENTALFSLFGNTFGGDSPDTFALPNLSDRAPAPSLIWCVAVGGFLREKK